MARIGLKAFHIWYQRRTIARARTGVHRGGGALEIAVLDVVAFWRYIQVVIRLGRSRHVGAARALWVNAGKLGGERRVGQQQWIGGEDGAR